LVLWYRYKVTNRAAKSRLRRMNIRPGRE